MATSCGRFCNTVCQVLTGAVLFLLHVAALVANKVSLVWLLGGSVINTVHLEAWYAAFGLLFIVPELFALLKVVWNTSFIKRTRAHRWPSALALFVGFLTAFAEVASFLLFCVEVAPRLPGHVLLPLLQAVFAVSLCQEQWTLIQKKPVTLPQVDFASNFTLERKATAEDDRRSVELRSEQNRVVTVLLTILGFSGVWGTCAVSAVVSLSAADLPWFQALLLPSSLILLSLCWNPSVQVYTVRSSDGTFDGRWKASCIYTLFKLVILVAGVLTIMLFRLPDTPIVDAATGAVSGRLIVLRLADGLYACRHAQIFYPLLVHFVSSFVAHVIGYLACTLCLPGLVLTVPSLLATPAAAAVVILLCLFGDHWLDGCHLDDVAVWGACALAAVIWIAPYVIRRRALNRSSEIVLKPYDELFIQPTWNSVFIDQHMCLNYKFDGFSSSDHIILPPGEKINNRIFICTTMYRETDCEMGRLLKSLHKVSVSTKIKNTYFEGHIFMDNGCNDLHLTDFATQLISLLDSKLGVTVKDSEAYQTPYGVQLSWTLPGGMPFCIHLKDPKLVKDKKRWSQVMYLTYVLKFRMMRDYTMAKLKLYRIQNGLDSTIDDSLHIGYCSDKEFETNSSGLQGKNPNYRGHKKTRNRSAARSDSVPPPPPGGRYTATYGLTRATSHQAAAAADLDSSNATSYAANTDSTTSINTTMTSLQGGFSQDGLNVSSLTTPPHDLSSSAADLSYTHNLSSSSSDQGLGVSADDLSTVWSRASDPHRTGRGAEESSSASSTATVSANSSVRRAGASQASSKDDGWPQADYDGDLSSTNTSSLASRAPPRRPPPLRQTSAPDRPTRRGGLVQRQNSQTSQTCLLAREDSFGGHENPGFWASSTDSIAIGGMSASQTLNTGTAPPPPLPRGGSGSTTGSTSDIFKISHDAVPATTVLERVGAGGAVAGGSARIELDDHTYILATDADMEFDDDSVKDLLDLCNGDRRIGGACGRTHPIGQRFSPLVGYQKFEYAKDFWMIKSAQNVIGSVMCCPGCFSLYRAGAIRDVMAYYAGPTDSPYEVFVKDTGEDRWMCTLMMIHGWKLEYTAFCSNTTFCPDNFKEFMKQRRRWVLSDMSNMLLVFQHIMKLARKNDAFSLAFICYMLQMFLIVVLSASSTIAILAGGLDIVFGLPYSITAPLLGCIVLIYALICILASPRVQVTVTFVLTLLLGAAMLLIVTVGAIHIIMDFHADWGSGVTLFKDYYLILTLVAAVVLAALLHPREAWILLHTPCYLLGFPGMQILLPIYAMCNIVDQSWGTRDENQSKAPPVTCFSKNRKKYHRSLSRRSQVPDEDTTAIYPEDEDVPVDCTSQFKPLQLREADNGDEYIFWDRLRCMVLGKHTNLGLSGSALEAGLRSLRKYCLAGLIVVNALWLVLLSVLFFNVDVSVAEVNVYTLLALVVYGLVLVVQFVGMTMHRCQAVFTRFSRRVFGADKHMWIHTR